MAANDSSNGSKGAAEGQWECLAPDSWMPFREALKQACDVMSVSGEEEGSLDLIISALGTRIKDGLIRFEARRTERWLQYEGLEAEIRGFNEEDRTAFAAFLYSTCKGPGNEQQDFSGKCLSLIDFEPYSGDFSYKLKSTCPPWDLSYSAWDLRLSRDDVDACWPPAEQPAGARPSLAALMAKSGKGRPAAGWWPAFAEELAAYIHEVGIPAGQGTEGQSAVIDAICDRLARQEKPEPSRSTIQPVINAVLRRLRGEHD